MFVELICKYLNTFFLKEFPCMVVMSSHIGEMHLLVNDKENYPNLFIQRVLLGFFLFELK